VRRERPRRRAAEQRDAFAPSHGGHQASSDGKSLGKSRIVVN